jgi:Tic22-like family
MRAPEAFTGFGRKTPPPSWRPLSTTVGRVLVHAVVSAETEKAVETFVRREDAEPFLEEVRGDDPELAELLRLEPVELYA